MYMCTCKLGVESHWTKCYVGLHASTDLIIYLGEVLYADTSLQAFWLLLVSFRIMPACGLQSVCWALMGTVNSYYYTCTLAECGYMLVHTHAHKLIAIIHCTLQRRQVKGTCMHVLTL